MAVYTEVPDEELFAFLAGYDIGDLLSCKGIAEGVENTNYYLHTTQGSFILTLYEKRVNEADLPFFLGLMQHLAAKGLNCPLPVKNRGAETLGRLAGRPAALFTFLDGLAVRRPSAQHCAALGSALAQLRKVAKPAPPRSPPKATQLEGAAEPPRPSKTCTFRHVSTLIESDATDSPFERPRRRMVLATPL